MITQAKTYQPPAGPSLRATAEERRRLGRSVWLFLLLQQWTQGGQVRSGESIRVSEIAAVLGVGPRQTRRELHRLRKAGYVTLQNTGRGFKIRVLEPRRAWPAQP